MQVEPRGTLRLSASVTFGQRITVPRLSGFRARYPAVTVEGLFSDSIIDLVADRVDLAIRLAPMIDGNYVVSKLMDTRYRVVAAPDCLRRSSSWSSLRIWLITGPSSFPIGITGPDGYSATLPAP